jgi:hypothetical protein
VPRRDSVVLSKSRDERHVVVSKGSMTSTKLLVTVKRLGAVKKSLICRLKYARKACAIVSAAGMTNDQ